MVELAKRIIKPYTIPTVNEINESENILMNRRKSHQERENQTKIFSDLRKKNSTNELKILEDPLSYIKSTFETNKNYRTPSNADNLTINKGAISSISKPGRNLLSPISSKIAPASTKNSKNSSLFQLRDKLKSERNTSKRNQWYMPADLKFTDIKINLTAAEKMNNDMERLKDKSQIPYYNLNKLSDGISCSIPTHGLPKILKGKKDDAAENYFQISQEVKQIAVHSKGGKLFKKCLIDNNIRIPNFLKDIN